MSALLDLYSDVVGAKELLESARANMTRWPDEADDWKALNDLFANVDQAIAALSVPAEITQAVEAEEAAIYESECLADRASY